MSPRVIRAGLVVLLVGAAYFASRPLTSCAFPLGLRFEPEFWRFCLFGSGSPAFDRSGPGPLWPYVIFAASYLLAAVYIARARITLDAPGSDRTPS